MNDKWTHIRIKESTKKFIDKSKKVKESYDKTVKKAFEGNK